MVLFSFWKKIFIRQRIEPSYPTSANWKPLSHVKSWNDNRSCMLEKSWLPDRLNNHTDMQDQKKCHYSLMEESLTQKAQGDFSFRKEMLSCWNAQWTTWQPVETPNIGRGWNASELPSSCTIAVTLDASPHARNPLILINFFSLFGRVFQMRFYLFNPKWYNREPNECTCPGNMGVLEDFRGLCVTAFYPENYRVRKQKLHANEQARLTHKIFRLPNRTKNLAVSLKKFTQNLQTHNLIWETDK